MIGFTGEGNKELYVIGFTGEGNKEFCVMGLTGESPWKALFFPQSRNTSHMFC